MLSVGRPASPLGSTPISRVLSPSVIWWTYLLCMYTGGGVASLPDPTDLGHQYLFGPRTLGEISHQCAGPEGRG